MSTGKWLPWTLADISHPFKQGDSESWSGDMDSMLSAAWLFREPAAMTTVDGFTPIPWRCDGYRL